MTIRICRAAAYAVTTAAALAAGCSSSPSGLGADQPSAAAPTIAGSDPAYAHRGDSVVVAVTGANFVSGAQVAVRHGGAADPKVQVLGTTFVSASQVKATLKVDAATTLQAYDIVVTNPDTHAGTSAGLFVVTSAMVIPGAMLASGATDILQIAGQLPSAGAFFFTPGGGLVTLGSPGRGYDISSDGSTIVGASGASAYVSKLTGATWAATALPSDATASAVVASSIASDPTTGAPVLIGGYESPASGSGTRRRRESGFPPVRAGRGPCSVGHPVSTT